MTSQTNLHGILAISYFSMLVMTGFSLEKLKYELHDRTVWASGQTARTKLTRYKKVPVVTWTKQAEALVKERWTAVQHRATCERVMWMGTWSWGKTSQLRDWLDYAIVSVFTHNRTIIEHYSPKHHSSWCAKGNWLNCFFEPFHGKQCDGVTPQGPQANSITEYGGLHNFIKAKYHCAQNTARVHEAFPNAMWDKLVAAKHVVYRDGDTNSPMTANDLENFKRNSANLYYGLSLSALKSIIVHRILVFHKNIRHQAHTLTQNMTNKPVIAVHMRRTDKHTDRGVASRLDFSDKFVTTAINIICNQYFPPNGTNARDNCFDRLPSGMTILALSDDASAITTLRRHLGPKFNVRTLFNVSKLLYTQKERSEYKSQGHLI